MNELKKLSLFIILDAYVTKNAIEEFLATDWSQLRDHLIHRNIKYMNVDQKMSKYKNYLSKELEEIELFLNDEENIHWVILGYTRDFFDKNLPKHKRKIKWFHSIDRYPFDYAIFLPS